MAVKDMKWSFGNLCLIRGNERNYSRFDLPY